MMFFRAPKNEARPSFSEHQRSGVTARVLFRAWNAGPFKKQDLKFNIAIENGHL